MEESYFEMLDETCRDLANEIESHLGAAIEIKIDASRNDTMACDVDRNGPEIITPNSGHFPSNSVYHELLHIHRFCVNSVPKIIVCDSFSSWLPELEDELKELDNDIEHLIIVTEECEKYKERKEYWVNMIVNLIDVIKSSKMDNDGKERRALIYWVFSKHALNGSSAEEASYSLIQNLRLEERAEAFLKEIKIYINEKDKLVRVFFNHLNLSLDIGCLEYINCINKTCREETIPELN